MIAASSLAVWWSTSSLQEQVQLVREEYVELDAGMDHVRQDLSAIGVLLRSFYLDRGQVSVEDLRQRFRELREGATLSLAQLEDATSGFPSNQHHYVLQMELRLAMEQFWENSVEALGSPVGETAEERGAHLTPLVQQREHLDGLIGQLEEVIRANFLLRQEELVANAIRFRTGFFWALLLAVLCGAIVSTVTVSRMITLERFSQNVESELRRLSVQTREAQETERKSLSRELHDQIGQQLTGLRMELGSLARLAEGDAALLEGLERPKRTVEQLIGTIRNIALLLRPSMLDDLGLRAAVSWLAREVSRSTEMHIDAEVDEKADHLPEAHRTCLYRVIQEALTNASRHSGARKVAITLKTSSGWVRATISDDGRGFATGPSVPRGLGLIGMEERVKELGGSLNIVSSLGRGTRVEIGLPQPVKGSQ